MKKKHKVAMLATEGNGPITTVIGEDKIFLTSGIKVWIDDFECNHVYILSDDEIKEGDWCYHPTFGKGIIKTVHGRLCYYAGPRHEGDGSFTSPIGNVEDKLSKIIATTDPKLIINKSGWKGMYKSDECDMPQIPQSFVEAFVEKQGIWEVELEYEHDDTVPYPKTRLKIVNNEVVWSLPEEKIYSKSDLDLILNTALNRFHRESKTKPFFSNSIADFVTNFIKKLR